MKLDLFKKEKFFLVPLTNYRQSSQLPQPPPAESAGALERQLGFPRVLFLLYIVELHGADWRGAGLWATRHLSTDSGRGAQHLAEPRLSTQPGCIPGAALTCVAGRAAPSPALPGCGAQAWGCWSCSPETYPWGAASRASLGVAAGPSSAADRDGGHECLGGTVGSYSPGSPSGALAGSRQVGPLVAPPGSQGPGCLAPLSAWGTALPGRSLAA